MHGKLMIYTINTSKILTEFQEFDHLEIDADAL